MPYAMRSAAMEAILSIARTTATRFKMQGAINLNRFLPFPTPAEAVDLRGGYNMSANRGLPCLPTLRIPDRENGGTGVLC